MTDRPTDQKETDPMKRTVSTSKLSLRTTTIRSLGQVSGGLMRRKTDSCYTYNNDPDCTDTCFAAGR